jgi:hypothetical protein
MLVGFKWKGTPARDIQKCARDLYLLPVSPVFERVGRLLSSLSLDLLTFEELP